MQVNRITLDRELGLIHLETGPGGDSNYVLLPLEVPPTAAHLLDRYHGEDEKAVAMEDFKVPEDATLGIDYPTGWTVPKDQEYDHNPENRDAELEFVRAHPIKAERGGIKYPNGPVPKPVTVQASPAEVPKSAKTGCKCGAHKVPVVVQNVQPAAQLLGTPDPFPVLAFVRKGKFPTWYVTVPSVARLRINNIHSDSIHLIPDMVRSEIDKLTGKKIASEKVHLVFPHDQRNTQI